MPLPSACMRDDLAVRAGDGGAGRHRNADADRAAGDLQIVVRRAVLHERVKKFRPEVIASSQTMALSGSMPRDDRGRPPRRRASPDGGSGVMRRGAARAGELGAGAQFVGQPGERAVRDPGPARPASARRNRRGSGVPACRDRRRTRPAPASRRAPARRCRRRNVESAGRRDRARASTTTRPRAAARSGRSTSARRGALRWLARSAPQAAAARRAQRLAGEEQADAACPSARPWRRRTMVSAPGIGCGRQAGRARRARVGQVAPGAVGGQDQRRHARQAHRRDIGRVGRCARRPAATSTRRTQCDIGRARLSMSLVSGASCWR